MANELCLHCNVIDAINRFYEARGVKHGTDTVMDVHEILENLGQVAAEFIAGHPEKAQRDRLVKMLSRGIRDAVPVMRARGPDHYPKALVAS